MSRRMKKKEKKKKLTPGQFQTVEFACLASLRFASARVSICSSALFIFSYRRIMLPVTRFSSLHLFFLFLNLLPFSFSNHYLAPDVDRLIRFPGVCSLREHVALGYSVLQLMVFTFYVDVDFHSPEALSTWQRRLKGLSN